MSFDQIRASWQANYSSVPKQLERMKEVEGLVSAFNANMDAVIKVSGKQISELITKHDLDVNNILSSGERSIQTPADAIRGLVHCFRNGIAEEWLINEVSVFHWLQKHLGYDQLQMGGQGGIVANVMAVCGVDPVYVHCASLPEQQASLFLDLDNLLSTTSDGQLEKAHSIARASDIPLIHWIIEFDRGDEWTIGDQTFSCPKSNRFIATYDPLNFKLHMDPHFAQAISSPDIHLDYVILSGYQMLNENLADGARGSDRIDDSIRLFTDWKKQHPRAVFHLEMASTPDKTMRKYLLDHLAPKVDSLGFNERELIDLLEVMGETALAQTCNEDTHAANLFQAMLKVQQYTQCPRLQLHLFGLYLTIQTKGFRISAEQNRNGMQLAATIAAAKAGTGAIHTPDVLLWAHGREIADIGITELENLYAALDPANNPEFQFTGLGTFGHLNVIAVPTILIDKPITLVGMGDTISSVSLVNKLSG